MEPIEAMSIIGKTLYKKFSLDNQERLSTYIEVFNSLASGIEDEMHKSILLVGSIGSGKTLLMKVMHQLFRDTNRKFYWLNSYELSDMIDCMNSFDIKQQFGKTFLTDLYIDDIGSLNQLKNKYGNKINIVSELLNERYDLFTSRGIKTHLSSNLLNIIDKNLFPDIQTLEDSLGERISDRVVEFSETIVLSGGSLRK